MNTELLARTMAAINTEPWRWDQKTWRRRKVSNKYPDCKSAMNPAGFAVTLAGDKFLIPDSELSVTNAYDAKLHIVIVENDGYDFIEDRARELLELTFAEAKLLFRPDNRLRDLRTIVTSLIEKNSYRKQQYISLVPPLTSQSVQQPVRQVRRTVQQVKY